MIGNRLKKLRETGGLKQDELAKILNIGKTAISNYENNSRLPSIEILKEISNYFDVSIDYILGLNNIGHSSRKDLRMSDEEIEFILELRKTNSYKNMISNPSNYAKLIETKTTGYKVKI